MHEEYSKKQYMLAHTSIHSGLQPLMYFPTLQEATSHAEELILDSECAQDLVIYKVVRIVEPRKSCIHHDL